MHIIITAANVHTFKDSLHPEVSQIKWTVGPLDSSVLSLFPNLEILDCSDLQLRTLDGLEGCPQLKVLRCNWNKLTSLDGIGSCKQLTELYVIGNELTNLVGIEACSQLRYLRCDDNNLVSLLGLEMSSRLQSLCLDSNALVSLRGIEACTKLKHLMCPNNQLVSLDPIIYLFHLKRFDYAGNPLAIQTPRIERLLQGCLHPNQGTSVHIRSRCVKGLCIDKSVCESIMNLLTDSRPQFAIKDIIDSDLDKKTKSRLVEYCLDKTVHPVHLLTYIELLGYVWGRIMRSGQKVELLKTLSEQIIGAESFTSGFDRTLLVLGC